MNNKSEKWVAAWGNATSITNRKPESYAKNITLRYPMYIPFSGNKLKFLFTNFCGTEPITISKATVAISNGADKINVNTLKEIKFNGGNTYVTIDAGTDLTSDAVDIDVSAGDFINVSFYLGDFTEMRSGVIITGPLSSGYFSIGDMTECEELPINTSRNTSCFYFISEVDVLTDSKNKAIICYGDSITAQSWPDYLTLRLRDERINNVSVIRRAASGTRILRQYDCITYDSYGLKGDIRFPNEIRTAGAETIIIQQGINDIIHPVGTNVNKFRPMSDLPNAQQLIDGLRYYIKTAKANNINVYLGTLLPILGWRTYADFREKIKFEVNEWICNNDEADGFIDFDKAVCDLGNPLKFREGFDSGDHLHPSELAYEMMAKAVPKELFI